MHLLNAFAISVGEVNVFSLIAIVFFVGQSVYCLPKSMCVVFVIPVCVSVVFLYGGCDFRV